MKVKAELDLGEFYNEDWGTDVENAVRGELTALVRAEVKEWFKENKKIFQKHLQKYGLQVMDGKIIEAAVASLLKSIKPL